MDIANEDWKQRGALANSSFYCPGTDVGEKERAPNQNTLTTTSTFRSGFK